MIVSCADRKLDMVIKAPPSKSIYHRELIVRFLLGDRDHLEALPDDSEDVIATKGCLRALAVAKPGKDVILPCNESGSTLRFMIPVASAYLLREDRDQGCRIIAETKGRLYDRPVEELEAALLPHGIKIERDDDTRSIRITGTMTSGEYVIDGSVSSQYISGLLMALPLMLHNSSVRVTGQMKSIHYIDLTRDVLTKYGCDIPLEDGVFTITSRGYDKELTSGFEVEGDWSNGAFLLCMSRWSDITVEGLDPASRQGDRAIVDFLNYADDPDHRASGVWDCTDTPDIAPYMAVVSAFLFDKMTLTGIGRLRIKESDRVTAVRQQLDAIGVKTSEDEDTLTVYGYDAADDNDRPIRLSSYHDHRMAMCAILIAVILKEEVDIDDVDCLNKSFPQLRSIIEKEMKP